jgi:hypothetical protein
MGSISISHVPGALKKFKRTPWRFQQTFQTPLQQLKPFVAMICEAVEDLQRGELIIEGFAFGPDKLAAFAQPSSIALLKRDGVLTATGPEALNELLFHALSDWLDFAFIPTPKPFVIYADHDEFITFFANSKANLNRVTIPLKQQDFKEVDYIRTLT